MVPPLSFLTLSLSQQAAVGWLTPSDLPSTVPVFKLKVLCPGTPLLAGNWDSQSSYSDTHISLRSVARGVIMHKLLSWVEICSSDMSSNPIPSTPQQYKIHLSLFLHLWDKDNRTFLGKLYEKQVRSWTQTKLSNYIGYLMLHLPFQSWLYYNHIIPF